MRKWFRRSKLKYGVFNPNWSEFRESVDEIRWWEALEIAGVFVLVAISKPFYWLYFGGGDWREKLRSRRRLDELLDAVEQIRKRRATNGAMYEKQN